MRQAADDPVLDLAGEAIHREAWDEAYGLLSEADQSGGSTRTHLPTLADTAYWRAIRGRPSTHGSAFTRRRCVPAKTNRGRGGGQVATLLLYTGLLAPARGWIRRAEAS